MLERLQEQIGALKNLKWIFQFFFSFAAFAHLLACLWIIIGQIDPDDNSWTHETQDWSRSDIYLTSFYFTITTITTVGYGDISASTFLEKIIAIVIMFTGVIAFSFASGSLTNYIAEQDQSYAQIAERMEILDRL